MAPKQIGHSYIIFYACKTKEIVADIRKDEQTTITLVSQAVCI